MFNTYHGGRFETIKKTHINTKIYDIKSTYPWHLYNKKQVAFFYHSGIEVPTFECYNVTLSPVDDSSKTGVGN